ncbi:MAG: DUF1269 domain-containing protein [Acidimicrobiales bacterium]
MATLTVWKFPTADGAEAAQREFIGAAKQELITIEDSAVVSWPQGDKKPKTHQAVSTAGEGALGGLFWGMLFGLIFLIPLIGGLIGAATGALVGALSDFGIDDDFIKRVRGEVTEGTSALFLLSDGAVVDRLTGIVAGATLIESNLSDEQAARLQAALAS